MQKSLDLKLKNIHQNPLTSNDFILADAKDADLAFGLASPGRSGGRGMEEKGLEAWQNFATKCGKLSVRVWSILC